MAVSAESMANALTRARYLISQEGENKIKEIKSQEGYDPSYKDYLTESSYGDYDYQQIAAMQQQQQNIPSASSCKLPKAILDSMLTEEIDVSKLNPNSLDNVLKQVEKNIPVKQQITEERITPSNTSGIDYNYIKAIIEEVIDKKLNTINENTLKGIKLKEGKIALVDNSGNVFHATLEYKGKQKK